MKKRRWILGLIIIILWITGCSAESQVDTNQQIEEAEQEAAAESETETKIEIAPMRETEASDSQKPETQQNEDISNQSFGPVSEEEAKAGDFPVVYFTSEISPERLIEIYEALDRSITGQVAVKLHMGEPGGQHYLSPELLKDFVVEFNGTFVDSNTAYGGRRASTAMHLQAAEDHGFAAVAPVDILDAEGDFALPVEDGKHLTANYVGSHLENYDFIVILSHFKGHAMGGFGGAIKNMSVGIASRKGKCLIHTAGDNEKSMRGGDQNEFLESMAESAKSIANYAGDSIIYINIMNNLSIDCDCDSHPAAPCMDDIGILASLDPLALDQACVDLIYASEDGEQLIKRIESRNGLLTLEHAQDIGLGSRRYLMVDLDD